MVKNPPADVDAARDLGLILRSGRSPGVGNGNPLQYSLPGKSHGWWNLVGCSPWGRKESDTTEQLHFHFKLLQSCSTLWTVWTVAGQIALSVGFSRQEYWSGVPYPPSGDLPNPGIEPGFLMSPALAAGFFTTSATWEDQIRCVYLDK